MRKIFIDGGANIGQSTEAFLKFHPKAEEFEIHCFEPSREPSVLNPLKEKLQHLWNTHKPKDIKLYEEAIWIEDGKIKFFDEGSESSSVHLTMGLRGIDKPITVECFDFSNWLKDNFDKDDFIVLKLDIEGAEYDVVKKMCADQSIDYINLFYCEIHGSKCYKTLNESIELLNMAAARDKKLYVWGPASYDGKIKNTSYTEELLKGAYIRWYHRDIESMYPEVTNAFLRRGIAVAGLDELKKTIIDMMNENILKKQVDNTNFAISVEPVQLGHMMNIKFVDPIPFIEDAAKNAQRWIRSLGLTPIDLKKEQA